MKKQGVSLKEGCLLLKPAENRDPEKNGLFKVHFLRKRNAKLGTFVPRPLDGGEYKTECHKIVKPFLWVDNRTRAG